MRQSTAVIATLVVLAIWSGWTIYLLSLNDFSTFEGSTEPFSATGQFGDSFRVLASLLSALALIGALFSIHIQSKNYQRQQFEGNFYILLQSLRQERDAMHVAIRGEEISKSLIKNSDYHRLKSALIKNAHRFEGTEAFAVQLYRVRDAIGPEGYRDRKGVARAYRKVLPTGVRYGNYFRMLYHLYCMIRDSGLENDQFYARILRSHITSYEACLLAYNCSIDEGRHKFKGLVEKYSAFHNMRTENLDPYEAAELRFFERMFDENAFRFEDLSPVKY